MTGYPSWCYGRLLCVILGYDRLSMVTVCSDRLSMVILGYGRLSIVTGVLSLAIHSYCSVLSPWLSMVAVCYPWLSMCRAELQTIEL